MLFSWAPPLPGSLSHSGTVQGRGRWGRLTVFGWGGCDLPCPPQDIRDPSSSAAQRTTSFQQEKYSQAPCAPCQGPSTECPLNTLRMSPGQNSQTLDTKPGALGGLRREAGISVLGGWGAGKWGTQHPPHLDHPAQRQRVPRGSERGLLRAGCGQETLAAGMDGSPE